MKPLICTVTAIVVMLSCAPSFAADVCPNGVIATVRISTLKPTGTRGGFDKAVADNLKWYRDRGYTTNDMVDADVLDLDKAADTYVVSKTEIMTIHYNSPDVRKSAHDAAWEAFVAEYRANSDLTSEKTACLPKRN